MQTFSLPVFPAGGETFVRSDIDKNLTILTLNRPTRCNSLNAEMLDSFLIELRQLHEEDRPIVVLQGSGSTFCTGLDLYEAAQFLQKNPPEELALRVVEVVRLLATLPGALVTVAQRAAFGGGAVFVAVSDLVIADTEFRLSLPELQWGFPPHLLHPFLEGKIPRSAMAELLLTGQSVDVETAKRWGLVHRIVDKNDLEAELVRLVQQIRSGNSRLLLQAKSLLLGRKVIEENFTAFQEGVSAFVEKRPPQWDE